MYTSQTHGGYLVEATDRKGNLEPTAARILLEQILVLVKQSGVDATEAMCAIRLRRLFYQTSN